MTRTPLHLPSSVRAACAALLTLALLAGAARAAAPPTRLATVDVRAVVMALPVADQVRARLAELTQQRAHALERQKRALVEAAKAVDASTDPEPVRATKRDAIEQQRKQLMATAHGLEGDLRREEEKLLRPVYAEIDATVAALAATQGVALVLRKPLSGIVYQAPGVDLVDLTEQVVARMKREGAP